MSDEWDAHGPVLAGDTDKRGAKLRREYSQQRDEEVAVFFILHMLARRYIATRPGLLACPLPGVLRACDRGRMQNIPQESFT